VGSGLVYAAVILLWAVVLVPQWLRRHDRNSEHRTTLTFHRAMRTLERRRSARGVSRARHDIDITVAGARSRVHDRVSLDEAGVSAIDRHLDEGVDPFVGGHTEQQLRDARRIRSQVRAREAAAHRRKQVQQGLIGLSIVSVVLLVMGVLPMLLASLAPLALAAFWFMARQQQKTAVAADQRLERRGAAKANMNDTAPIDVRERRSRKNSQRQRRETRRHVDGVPAVAYGMPDFADTPDVQLINADEGRWAPVDAPLPLYIDEDVDQRPVATDWTSERMLEQVEALRTPGADAENELGLDAFVEIPGSKVEDISEYQHRRAANE